MYAHTLGDNFQKIEETHFIIDQIEQQIKSFSSQKQFELQHGIDNHQQRFNQQNDQMNARSDENNLINSQRNKEQMQFQNNYSKQENNLTQNVEFDASEIRVQGLQAENQRLRFELMEKDKQIEIFKEEYSNELQNITEMFATKLKQMANLSQRQMDQIQENYQSSLEENNNLKQINLRIAEQNDLLQNKYDRLFMLYHQLIQADKQKMLVLARTSTDQQTESIHQRMVQQYNQENSSEIEILDEIYRQRSLGGLQQLYYPTKTGQPTLPSTQNDRLLSLAEGEQNTNKSFSDNHSQLNNDEWNTDQNEKNKDKKKKNLDTQDQLSTNSQNTINGIKKKNQIPQNQTNQQRKVPPKQGGTRKIIEDKESSRLSWKSKKSKNSESKVKI